MVPSSLIRSPFEGCKTLIYFIIRNKNKLIATKFIHKSHSIQLGPYPIVFQHWQVVPSNVKQYQAAPRIIKKYQSVPNSRKNTKQT